MHYIDIILIAILLIFTFIGFKRGLIDSVLSLFGTLASLVIAIFVAKPFAGFLEKILHISKFYTDKITPAITKASASFSTVVEGEAITANQALESSSLSTLLKKIFGFFTKNTVINVGETPAEVFAKLFAGVLVLLTAGIVAFILIKLAVFIIGKIFDAIFSNHVLNSVDKFLGVVFGLAKGALVVAILLAATVFIAPTSFGAKVTTEIEKTKITKIAYEPITNFVESKVQSIDFNKIVSGYFNNK